MSLYNMVHGMNGNLVVVGSAILGFRIDQEIPRFRDIFTKDEECPVTDYDLLIYTRMGGGNYECWGNDDGEYDTEDCDCPACKLSRIIDTAPWVVTTYDDSYDETYKTIVVKFNDEQKKLWNTIVETNSIECIKDKALELFPEIFNKEKTE